MGQHLNSGELVQVVRKKPFRLTRLVRMAHRSGEASPVMARRLRLSRCAGREDQDRRTLAISNFGRCRTGHFWQGVSEDDVVLKAGGKAVDSVLVEPSWINAPLGG